MTHLRLLPDLASPLTLLVTNIGELVTVCNDADDGGGPRRGVDLADVGAVPGAALALSNDRVLGWGPQDELLAALSARPGFAAARRVDAGGKCVVPGWVDPHTHAVFGRTRQDEYARRIRGETYLQIAAAGGGIHASVRDLRARSEQELVDLTVPRLREMVRHGTTTVEIKSGYGLTLHDELKMLRAAGRAAEEVGVRLVRTCLAAHELPAEYARRRADYVRLIVEEILPRVVEEKLAERCDVPPDLKPLTTFP